MGLFDRFKSGTTPTQQGLTAKGWHDKGIAHFASGRDQEALQCYDKALEIDPNDTIAWTKKGNALFVLGFHQEALQCYDRVLKIDPKNAEARDEKESALYVLGRR